MMACELSSEAFNEAEIHRRAFSEPCKANTVMRCAAILVYALAYDMIHTLEIGSLVVKDTNVGGSEA